MKTLETFGELNKIPVLRDDKETEFEVQAALFAALRSHGFNVRGEVRWTSKRLRETCRFDLVLYENGCAAHIVEVKAAPMKHKLGVEATRQGRRYRNFGVPVTFVYGAGDAAEFLKAQIARRERSYG